MNRFSFADVKLPETEKAAPIQEKRDELSLDGLKSKLQDIFPAERPFEKYHQKPVTLEDGTVVKLPGTEALTDCGEISAEKLYGENREAGDRPEALTEEEKEQVRKETGWSDEIIDAIGSMEEYEIYKNAGLVEAEVNGKKCLIRNDIDWEQKDTVGRTNKERAEQGLPPVNKDGKVIELHHIGQHADSPLAELTPEEHRGKGNDSILHDKTKASEIDRQVFARERSEHWGARTGQ